MARRDTRKQRDRLEAVAAIIGRSHGYTPMDGHGEGSHPLLSMAESKLVDGKVYPANPRAMAFVKTAREILQALSRKDLR